MRMAATEQQTPEQQTPQQRAERDRARTEAGAALYGLVMTAVRHGPREISLTAGATLATVERTGPRRITDLAAIEGVAQPSMTVLVTSLEKAGLVERLNDPGDQRVVLVALTAAGADYLRARRRAGAEVIARLIDELPADEAAAVLAAAPALEHLRELAEQQRAAANREAQRAPGRREKGTGR